MLRILSILFFLTLLKCSSISKQISGTSSPQLSPCPNYTGVFQCPAMPNVEYSLPEYIFYGKTEKNTEGAWIYTSYLSISPEIKSKIIANGKRHSSVDHRGVKRVYTASCNKGVLINKYSTSRGTAETKVWLDKKSNLNILYDFAKGKVLICNRVASTSDF